MQMQQVQSVCSLAMCVCVCVCVCLSMQWLFPAHPNAFTALAGEAQLLGLPVDPSQVCTVLSYAKADTHTHTLSHTP